MWSLCLDSYFLHRDVQLLKRPFVRNTTSGPLYCLCTSVKDKLVSLCGFTSGLYSVPLICLFFCQYHMSLLLQLYSRSWNQVVSVLQLCSSPSRPFWVFCLSIYILESVCWYLPKSLLGIFFYCDCTESVGQVGNNWHLDGIVFLSMNMDSLSIYLILLWFIRVLHFSYTDLVYNLLAL